MSIKLRINDIKNLKLLFIYQKLNNYERKTDFLEKISIPYSSFNVMRKRKSNYIDDHLNNSHTASNPEEFECIILKTLKDCVVPLQYPLTIKRIQQLIFEKIGVYANKWKIKYYLKDLLNYTYKKGWSGSKVMKTVNNKLQKSTFSSRMLLNIYTNKLSINIDESSF